MTDDLLLINAYLDGELDAAAVLDVERRLRDDASLRAEYDRLAALRRALAANLRKDRASDALRRRIARIAAPPGLRTPFPSRDIRGRSFDWRQMAASVLVACVLASSATTLALRSSSGSDIAAIVAGHQRALLAAAPVDVESSDRHTVKPWIDTKLAVSPQVIDLAAAGFPLVGGRVEVVGGKPVPAMVYKRRQHLVSVVAMPKAGSRDDGAPPSRTTRDGFTILGWPGQDFRYFAVSDVAPDDLATFVAAWRAEAEPM